MNTKIENKTGCSRTLTVELSTQELNTKFDQVYAQIGKRAKIPGYRPGKAPRDLLQARYSEQAKEEVIKQAIPEFYWQAIQREQLVPVASPEIEDIQFKNETLLFKARLDVRPQIKIKHYRNIKINRKKISIESQQVDEALERLGQSRAKDKKAPEINQQFAQDLGFKTLDDLREAIRNNLQANAEREVRLDMERQILDELLQKTSMDIPQTLVDSQTRELIDRLKLYTQNKTEEKQSDLQNKEKELEQRARKEATRRVKLSFILEEIAGQEHIQAEDSDLDERIKEMAARFQRPQEEIRQYLEKENLIGQIKAEVQDKKTMEFLLREANIKEE